MARYDKLNKKTGSAQRPNNAPSSDPGKTQVSASPTPSARPLAVGKLRSMDQERAEFALGKIQGLVDGPESAQIEVRRYVNGLPALVRMNGLGQALAFYHMQGKDSAHERIYRIVGDWLCGEKSKGRVFLEGEGDALTAITRSDIHAYMAAQNEALALLEWLKKFALALLKKDEKS
ncbi:MAG: type III-B CRISPR module-associated protein Cmr5 [Thauera sp.]|jgi:CRISPR-associated protein Cmr5|nr:type III-B CRISPR module-associated protein Cmr5 [Thauera sp.]